MLPSLSHAKSTMSGRMLMNPDHKLERSAEFFKSTRVNSCSYVRLKKGNAEAVPFFQVADKNPQEHETKSTYNQSYSHETFKVRPNLHVGSSKKLLEIYNPTCYRSRLPVEEAPMLTKNGSQIEIGDRNFNIKRHFLSTAHNTYGNFGTHASVSNPGIQSEKTKWHHHLQGK